MEEKLSNRFKSNLSKNMVCVWVCLCLRYGDFTTDTHTHSTCIRCCFDIFKYLAFNQKLSIYSQATGKVCIRLKLLRLLCVYRIGVNQWNTPQKIESDLVKSFHWRNCICCAQCSTSYEYTWLTQTDREWERARDWVWKRDFGVNSIRHWMSTSVAIAAPSQSSYTITIWNKISIHVRAIMCENRWFVAKKRRRGKKVHQMRFNSTFIDGNAEKCHWNGKRVHVLLKRECEAFFFAPLISSSPTQHIASIIIIIFIFFSFIRNSNESAWLWSFQLDLFHSGRQKKQVWE